MDSVFTKPIAAKHLGQVLEKKNVLVEPDFYVESVDTERKVLVSYDERELPYDLLVSVPVNMGAEVIGKSGLGDELNHVPVDKGNHAAVDIFTENFLRYVDGLPMLEEFDGHANCFIESGHGKGLLIDFNYDTEPLPGKYPLPGIGPFSLLQETAANHWGKMMFRWIYWNILLRGRELPLPAEMMLAGKER